MLRSNKYHDASVIGYLQEMMKRKFKIHDRCML